MMKISKNKIKKLCKEEAQIFKKKDLRPNAIDPLKSEK